MGRVARMLKFWSNRPCRQGSAMVYCCSRCHANRWIIRHYDGDVQVSPALWGNLVLEALRNGDKIRIGNFGWANAEKCQCRFPRTISFMYNGHHYKV